MDDVTYDPALAAWMRTNTEQLSLTKPELVVIFAGVKVRDETVIQSCLGLSEDQKADIRDAVKKAETGPESVGPVVASNPTGSAIADIIGP